MTTDLARVLELVQNIRMFTVGGVKSPHKLLLLTALARLYAKNPNRGNAFPLDEELESEFRRASLEYRGEAEASSIQIEFPFYHLTSDGMWTLTPRKGKESLFRQYENRSRGRLTRSRLIETTEHGRLSQEFDHCFRDVKARERILEVIGVSLTQAVFETKVAPAFASLNLAADEEAHTNPFVGYLNSLIRLSAGNENALAEFQAVSPFFPLIHIPHPLTEAIVEELLRPDGQQVILTGHAGDGKSTIALGVYRKLTSHNDDSPLGEQMRPREDLPGGISIVKDLSERRRAQDAELTTDVLQKRRRFLIVSNTGALLDLFRGQCALCGRSASEVESDVLSAVSSDGGQGTLSIGGTTFLVLNLARIENLEIARQIFTRMVDPARWAECEGRACRANCPICVNVDLINRRREIVLERLFLAYRRMYEYGTRLTLRQITEHLAYLVTSGLEEADIAEMRARGRRPLKAEFMFFNRFFGDDGKADHGGALRMRAVQEVRRQGFGERPCPTWERKLWLKLRGGNFHLGVEDCDEEFDLLREHGSGPGSDSRPGMSPDQAREQVRRMLYFLYAFSDGEESYLKHFLNSPMILRWSQWQREGTNLGVTEKNGLEQRIYHVLQEHFTGVRLPEGMKGQDRRLYITLSRSKSDIRQSAQVVVAQVDWSDDTDLELEVGLNVAGGRRTDLELRGRNRINGVNLALKLPFLDYVVMRHVGEVGENLQAAYVERLERFKAQVQDVASEGDAQVMLVRLKTDHTFRREQYSVRDGKLEVNDAL